MTPLQLRDNCMPRFVRRLTACKQLRLSSGEQHAFANTTQQLLGVTSF